ncbi:MAG TPA: NAD(P)-binding domain-containing protein [Gaiellaceae bacterium]|nr:NAD(P)-binding domain-containing protein [Gaiellaceae bacterium]
MKVAVVGGTGPFGLALVRRLVEAGIDVTIGSRDRERAEAAATETGAASGTANAEAVAGADLVVLAVTASAALQTAAELAESIGETPVLSVASELHFRDRVAFPSDNPLSLAERTQELLDGPVVAGLHSVAAGSLAAGAVEGDALVCGDDADAKASALELASKLVSGRALDGGPLAGSRALENMCAVIVNLNRRYGGHGGLQIVGL